MTLPRAEIPAVFGSRSQAEEAVYELVVRGLADEHLLRAVQAGHHRALEQDADRAVFRSVSWGIAIGLPIGILLGAIMVYLGQLIAGATPTVGSVLGGGLGGSLAGVFFGSVFGISHSEHLLHEADPHESIELRPSEVLVVALPRVWEDEVGEVLHRHGGRPATRAETAAA